MDTKTCRTCKHALFELTPTGRIKNKAGYCRKVDTLAKAALESTRKTAPCVLIGRMSTHCVWPDYDATYCTEHEPK